MTEQRFYTSPGMADILQAVLRGEQAPHPVGTARFDWTDRPAASDALPDFDGEHPSA